MLSRVVSPVLASPSRALFEDTAARIALALVGLAGDPSIAIAIDTFGSATRFVAAVHDQTDAVAALTPSMRRRIRTLATGARVAWVLEETKRLQLHIVTPGHVGWPAQLDSMRGAAPLLLWARGESDNLAIPSVALTGTTAPTKYGVQMGVELATGLAGRGWALVTGAGSGIEQVVLRSAVAMNGKSIVVAATSLGHLRAPERGAVQVSELPPGFPVTLRSQWRAKHIIAAVGTKTIIVEAGISSSALRIAEAAQAMRRPVGVVLGPTPSPFNAGCRVLAQRSGVIPIDAIRDADWFH